MANRAPTHRRSGLFLALTLVLLPILAACGGATPSTPPASQPPVRQRARDQRPQPSPSEAASGGTFIGAWVGPCCNGNDWITPMDPGGDAHWFDKIYGRLTTFEVLDAAKQAADFDANAGVYGELTGDLAESWEISADQLTWTFKLRQGVTWHDGEPFTAERRQVHDRALLQPGEHDEAVPLRRGRGRRRGREGVQGRHGDRDHRRQGRRPEHDLVHVHGPELAVPDVDLRAVHPAPARAQRHPARAA